MEAPGGGHPPASMTAPGPGPGALAAIFALAILGNLGIHDLWLPDELRYTQVAWEMRHAADLDDAARQAEGTRFPPIHDYLVPHLNGRIYMEKPPLYLWLVSGFERLLGEDSVWASRLPPALAALGVALILLRLGRAMFGEETGRWAAALILTLPDFAWRSITGMFDLLLALFVLAAFERLWRYAEDPGRSLRHILWAFLWLALGTLAKGPVAFIAYACVFAAVFWRNDPKGFAIATFGTWGICGLLQLAGSLLGPALWKPAILWNLVGKGMAAWLFLAWRIALRLRAARRDGWPAGGIAGGLFSRKALAGLLLCVAVVAAWLAPACAAGEREDARFLRTVLVNQTLGRLGIGEKQADLEEAFDPEAAPRRKKDDRPAEAPHARPAHYYAADLPGLLLPWTLLAGWVLLRWLGRLLRKDPPAPWDPLAPYSTEPPASEAARTRRRHTAFLLMAFAAGAAFLSLAEGKRDLYALPILPLFLLALAPTIADLRRRAAGGEEVRVLRWAARLGLLASALGLLAAAGAAANPSLVERIAAGDGRPLPPGFREAIPRLWISAAGAAAAAGIFLAILRARRLALVPAGLVAALAILLPAGLHGILPMANAFKSVRTLVDQLRDAAGPGAAISTYGTRAHCYDYYWKGRIPLIDQDDFARAEAHLAGRAPAFLILNHSDWFELSDRPGFRASIHLARSLGSKKLILLAGNRPSARDAEIRKLLEPLYDKWRQRKGRGRAGGGG